MCQNDPVKRRPSDRLDDRSPDPLARATNALLARFQRQRPLRSGSLLISVLGDSIAPRGGAV